MNKRQFCILFTFFLLFGCSVQSGEVKLINSRQEWEENNITYFDFVWYSKDNCPWCERQEPVVELLVDIFPQIRFFKVKSSELAAEKRIRSFPTSLYQNKRWVGFTDKGTLERNIQGIIDRE